MNYQDYDFTFSIFNRTQSRKFLFSITKEKVELRLFFLGFTWTSHEDRYSKISPETLDKIAKSLVKPMVAAGVTTDDFKKAFTKDYGKKI